MHFPIYGITIWHVNSVMSYKLSNPWSQPNLQKSFEETERDTDKGKGRMDSIEHEKSLSVDAKEFVPGQSAPATAEDIGQPKKKKTKDERNGPRKRRHQRGKSQSQLVDDCTDWNVIYDGSNSITEPGRHDVFGSVASPKHAKVKSESDIGLWFDEMKQRRTSRLRQSQGNNKVFTDSLDMSPFSHMSLAFSPPMDWEFNGPRDPQQSLLDVDYLAEEEERKKWRTWALCAVCETHQNIIIIIQESLTLCITYWIYLISLFIGFLLRITQ